MSKTKTKRAKGGWVTRVLRPREVRADAFTIVRNPDGTRTFVGELSDLKLDTWPQASDQVWDDAADYGLTIVGRKHSVVFVVVHEERDDEGDLVAVHLKPAKQEVRRVPSARGVKVTIYND